MSQATRSTKIVHGRLAMRDSRLAAARAGAHGLQVMTFEQAAVRLAGGFCQPIDPEALRTAVQKALSTVDMGELERIKLLPGMVTASVDTLRKVWYAGINLNAGAKDDLRMLAIAQLEAAVLAILPRGCADRRISSPQQSRGSSTPRRCSAPWRSSD